MRIAIGGMMHESNTFATTIADRHRFIEGSFTTGIDMLPIWEGSHHEMGGFLAGEQMFGFEIVPTIMAWATPSGPVEDSVLDEVTETLISGCQANPMDGLLLALHGAMVTPKYPSADTELLRRVRDALGPHIPIIATLDFHGNCTPEMANYANAFIAYQTYPHIDQRQRGLLAAQLMMRTIRKEITPVCAIAKRPMILNLLGQNTIREPMASLMTKARSMELRDNVLSISVLAGFPYADVPNMGPSVVVVHNGNREIAHSTADQLAEQMWRVREELNIPCPSPKEAIALALASSRTPVILVDLGDNIGGGSSGDGTVLLQELIRQKVSGAIVVLYAPQAVKAASHLSIGSYFTGKVGGSVDRLHGDPVQISGVIRSMHQGQWEETEPRHGGRRFNDQGLTIVLTIDGPNTLVLNSLRTPPFSLGQLTSLGLNPHDARIIVVKAAVAYKAAYEPIAGKIIEVDTPGVTAINPSHFTYHHIPRPMFPLDN